MLTTPPVPGIVSEWAALIPLVVHLATPNDDFVTTGEVAFLRRVAPGLFPRLGTLTGYARLLDRGPRFLDYASSRGGSSQIVWDVKWGSVFPCANGAVSSGITHYLLGRSDQAPLKIPQTIELPRKKAEPRQQTADPSAATTVPPVTNLSTAQSCHGARSARRIGNTRTQLLHVLHFQRRKRPGAGKRGFGQVLGRVHESAFYQLLRVLVLTGLSVLLCLMGSYGTAVVLILSMITESLCRGVSIGSPTTYLESNESHDACMLVAAHQNATEWSLFIGDRGVVDTLLNKPMFTVPEGPKTRAVGYILVLAQAIQLVAVTYVAASKGWDGICLLVLLAVHWTHRLFFRGPRLAREWMRAEGITADTKTFEFEGRMAMILAIHLFGESKQTRWMDDIIVPHPRRESLLRKVTGECEAPCSELSEKDVKRIRGMSEAAIAAAETLKREMVAGDANV